MIRVLQVVTSVSMVAAISALAISPHYSISRDAIATTLRDAGMPVTVDQITPLADVVSSVAAPQLRVRSIQPGNGQQSVARIECVRSSECLPFVVTIHAGPGSSNAISATVANLSHTSHPAVHTGSVVVLYLDSGRVHIAIPVICLDNGVIGQTIRATSTDRSKAYLAKVVDSSSLKGTF